MKKRKTFKVTVSFLFFLCVIVFCYSRSLYTTGLVYDLNSENLSNISTSEIEGNDLVCDTPPVISFISGDGLSCYGDSDGNVLLTVVGGAPFPGLFPYMIDWDWDGSAGNDDYSCGCPSGEYEDLSNLEAGNYSVTVTDADGCTATATAVVTQPSSSITALAPDINLNCFGDTDGEIDLTVIGGTPDPFISDYYYDWDWDGTAGNDDLGGNPSITDDEQNPSGLEAGIYSVTVTDFFGCTAITSVEVIQPDVLDASANVNEVTCAGESTGAIDLSVSGGSQPYNYDWDNDGTGDNNDPQDLDNLPVGTYRVTITDANGCTTDVTADITEPSEPINLSISSSALLCFGDANGTINLTVSGGSGVYLYDWNNDGTGDNNDPEDLSGLPAGSYSVTVTDANGCTGTASTEIVDPPLLTGNLHLDICTGGAVTVNGTVYNASNTSGSEIFTSSQGCDSIVSVSVSFLPPLTGNIVYTGCTGDGYSVVVDGTLYDESNPSGSETLTNAEGCDSVVTINLSFSSGSSGTEQYTGCTGDGYSVTIGGTLYNESNPSGTEILTDANGCDSTVTIDLAFNSPTTGNELYNGCSGDGYFTIVGGTLYNESNPSGTETMTGSNGCDLIVTIDLNFEETSFGNENYVGCSGDGYSIQVNGTTYNEFNPTGTEFLINSNGCDSIVSIQLDFSEETTGFETYTGCEGDGYSVMVGGTVYNESNPSGSEILTNAQECDSIVTIDLVFNTLVEEEENYYGCSGDGYEVEVGNTIYNESNPFGSEMLLTDLGCDSLVIINLVFNASTEGTETYTGCEGDGYNVIVGNTVYNEFNPSGIEILTNENNCDSVVFVDLTYHSPTSEEINYSGCQGDGYEVIVGSTTYDQFNPTGAEFLTNSQGCDSVVTIDLNFELPDEVEESYVGCVGDSYSVLVGSTLYDENNPTGTEVLISSEGCDSIVFIDLTFADQIEVDQLYVGCSGDGYSILVGSTIYNEINPTGTESLVSSGGCDSIIFIDLSFSEPSTSELLYEGCIGDGYSITIGNNVYNELNPAGTETLLNETGCDSIITVDLVFLQTSASDIKYSGCIGDGYSIEINGTIYNEINPSGIETIPNSNGCDSVITIDLQFSDQKTNFLTHQGCVGDGYSVTVNGTIYDETNPSGQETIITGDDCDSTVIIELEFGDYISTLLDTTVCTNDSVIVNGTVYNAANPAGTEIYTAVNGCDSIVEVNLAFQLPASGQELYSGCMGDGYFVSVNGTMYNESNPVGIENITTVAGCDSIVSIELLFENCCSSVIDTQHVSICEGEIYSFLGTDLYVSGNYTDTIFNASGPGCDSIIFLELIVGDIVEILLKEEICEGEEFIFNNRSYLSSGSYTTTLLSSGSCDTIVSIDLIVYPLPYANAGEDQQLRCDQTSVVLQGSGSQGYRYWGGPGILEQEQNILNPRVQTEGMYILTITSSEGCESSDTMYVESAPQLPIAYAGADTYLTCERASVLLQGAAQGDHLQYFWTGPDIHMNNVNSQFPVVSMPGFYTVMVLDTLNNCASLPDTVLIYDQKNQVTARIKNPDDLNCNSTFVSLDASQSTEGEHIVYQWENEQHETISTSLVVEVPVEGVYFFHLVDTTTGCFDIDSIALENLIATPSVYGGEDKELNCSTSIAQLNVEGSIIPANILYSWSGPGIISEPIGLDIQVNLPGTYYVTAIDTINGCHSIDSISVFENNQVPVAEAGEIQTLTCHQTEVVLNANHSTVGEGILYVWLDIDNDPDTNMVKEVLNPGIYHLNVIDLNNGCVAVDSVEVLYIAPPEGNISTRSPSCVDERSGTILIDSVLGGLPPYLYSIGGSDFQESSEFYELFSGEYLVTVKDINECIWETTVTLEDPEVVEIDLGPDLELEAGDLVELEVSINVDPDQIDSIIWTPVEAVLCHNCPRTTVLATANTVLTATVYLENGCTATDVLGLIVNVHSKYIFSKRRWDQRLLHCIYRSRCDQD
jgi:hypothetical protein